MGDTVIDPVEYGRLLEQVAHLSGKVDSMEKSLETMDRNVQVMRNLMEQAKGGWRTLAWLGGLVSVVATGVSWVVSHMVWR
jgi:hypothetical protein